MKRFITTFLIFIMIFNFTGCSAHAAENYTVELNGINYSYQEINEIESIIDEQYDIMNFAHKTANDARALGYSETSEIILIAKNEYIAAQLLMEDCVRTIDDLENNFNNRIVEKEKEYPAATYIWKYLKQQGYNDYVCAGIIGNLMTEVGGQTLKLNYESANNNYYGICQWNKAYKEVWGASLSEQCKFLNKTMKYEFDSFGYAYKNDFNFEEFKNLKNERKAAKAFAKCYERCGSASYEIRQNNAEKAYKYFVY